jgi:hypothetical protein
MTASKTLPSEPLSDDEWQSRMDRLHAAEERARANQPTRCPACGASAPVPTWLEPDQWECSDMNCLATWTMGA